MALTFEFLSPNDKPAVVAISHPETAAAVRAALEQLGYKVHAPQDHSAFLAQYTQIQYQVVVFEELFNATVPSENLSLTTLQQMPMNQRRHSTVLLIGDHFKSMDGMQAFQQSVHGVLNRSDISSIGPVLQKVISDNELFLTIYRDTQLRMSQGKI